MAGKRKASRRVSLDAATRRAIQLLAEADVPAAGTRSHTGAQPDATAVASECDGEARSKESEALPQLREPAATEKAPARSNASGQAVVTEDDVDKNSSVGSKPLPVSPRGEKCKERMVRVAGSVGEDQIPAAPAPAAAQAAPAPPAAPANVRAAPAAPASPARAAPDRPTASAATITLNDVPAARTRSHTGAKRPVTEGAVDGIGGPIKAAKRKRSGRGIQGKSGYRGGQRAGHPRHLTAAQCELALSLDRQLGRKHGKYKIILKKIAEVEPVHVGVGEKYLASVCRNYRPNATTTGGLSPSATDTGGLASGSVLSCEAGYPERAVACSAEATTVEPAARTQSITYDQKTKVLDLAVTFPSWVKGPCSQKSKSETVHAEAIKFFPDLASNAKFTVGYVRNFVKNRTRKPPARKDTSPTDTMQIEEHLDDFKGQREEQGKLIDAATKSLTKVSGDLYILSSRLPGIEQKTAKITSKTRVVNQALQEANERVRGLRHDIAAAELELKAKNAVQSDPCPFYKIGAMVSLSNKVEAAAREFVYRIPRVLTICRGKQLYGMPLLQIIQEFSREVSLTRPAVRGDTALDIDINDVRLFCKWRNATAHVVPYPGDNKFDYAVTSSYERFMEMGENILKWIKRVAAVVDPQSVSVKDRAIRDALNTQKHRR